MNLFIDMNSEATIKDQRLDALVRLLALRKVITEDEANNILVLEPFPQRV